MATGLYLTLPLHGHMNPALPLVRELVARGETIVCWSTGEFRPDIERVGAHFGRTATRSSRTCAS